MASEEYKIKKVGISAFKAKGMIGLILKITGPLIDLILGINKINAIYHRTAAPGLTGTEFVEKLLRVLGVSSHIPEQDLKRIPREGPVIVVANHPFGGLEGVILAGLLSSVRRDVKILANVALKVFPELGEFFVFTNPLVTHNPKNIKSIKQCREHLENKGLLLLFPAGKVAYYRKDRRRVTDGDWNRIAAHLAMDLEVPVVPLFIAGRNSALFLFLGRIYYRFKLLMLPREFARKKKETIEIRCGRPLSPSYLKTKGTSREITDFLRMSCYALDPRVGGREEIPSETPPDLREMPPLLERPAGESMRQEIAALPEEQHLADFKHFSVYYGQKKQLNHIVKEITILREETFRELNEGSGQACDTDEFDSTYTHLFIWDHEQSEVIGAYRMGQTDRIPERYLSRMFRFSREFTEETSPALEMGRSFIVPRHQKSFYGLFLLWRGIGEFSVRHPRYRKLYGTVSLSNVYSRRSISLMDRLLARGQETAPALVPFPRIIHPEVEEYLEHYALSFEDLAVLVRSMEEDGKDLPILLKQYRKVGARFYTTGVDQSFLATPGLLLMVDLPEAPRSSLKMYMEEGLEPYLNYGKTS